MIYREDYQKSFKKQVRWQDTKAFLREEELGVVYPSYCNSEKGRYVCRPSRVDGIHDGYDRRMQAVKLADVFGIEKIWASIYEASRQHGDFTSKASTQIQWNILNIHLRHEAICTTLVGRTRHTRVWSQYYLWDHASNAQVHKAKWDTNFNL